MIIFLQFFIAVLLLSVFESSLENVSHFWRTKQGLIYNKNGVNIIVIPDVCITVASYDDVECEVSHVLYFVTADFQTRSNTVKALLI